MAQDLFTQLAQQTLANISTEGPAEVGDDPVSAIIQVAQERGIDPANLLGLAKLETQAGAKTVKGGGADTRNLFNVKDFSKDGTGIRARDGAEGSNDRYRAYGSYRESVEDLVGLLERRYPGAAKAGSPEAFARELKRGGYATDPAYESKLARVIRSSGGAARPVEQPQEWDQGARYAPVGVTIAGNEQPKPAAKGEPEGIVSSMGNAVWQGAKSLGRSVMASGNTALGDLTDVELLAAAQKDDAKNDPQAMQALQQEIAVRKKANPDAKWWQAIGDVGDAAWQNKLGTAQLIANQAPNSAVALGGGWAGGVAGAKLGALAAPFTGGLSVPVGATVGALAGMFLGNFAMEAGGKAIEKAEGGYTKDEANAAMTEGAKKAAVVTGVDALTLGAGKLVGRTVFGAPVRAGARAEAQVLANAGVDITNKAAIAQALATNQALKQAAIEAGKQAAKDASKWGTRATQAGTGLTMETLGEGTGEYLGEEWATGKGDVYDAALEALSSATQSVPQTAMTMASSNSNDLDPFGIVRAAKQSGGIVSRAGLAATPDAQQPSSAATQPTAAAATTGNAAAASPTQPAQTPIQASALSAIEQALEADKQRRRAAGEVVEDEVEEGDVVAAGNPAAVDPPDATPPPAMQAQPTQPAQPASAGFSLPAFDNSPIPKMEPAEAAEQRRQATEAQDRRRKRVAALRLGAYNKNPMMEFLGRHGLQPEEQNEFAPGNTERRKAAVYGYGPVFRKNGKPLDLLLANAQDEGFLPPDSSESDLRDLVSRTINGERVEPLYKAGIADDLMQRLAAEREAKEAASYEDYLREHGQAVESGDFDPLDSIGTTGYDFGDDDLADYAAATPPLQAEVSALAQHYYDLGFDPDEVLERLSIETENQPEQAYYDLAKSRFTQLIEQALNPGRAEGSAEQGGGRAVRQHSGQAGAAQADGSAAGGQGQAAAVTPPAAPAVAQPRRTDAIRAKLDDLKSQGFSQFTRSSGRTLLLNPDTYETVELTPAEMAVARTASGQARAGLQSLRGQRNPAQVDQQGVDVLQSYSPADVLTQEEQASQQQAADQAERDKAQAQARADDERKRIEQASYAAADSFELGQNPLDSLTGQKDIFGAAPVAQGLAGEKINDEWTAFGPQSGTLGIPRAEMPQIKAEHRGAMMGFLKARGIDGQQETIPSAAIKPTQAEFSPAKVKQAIDYQGGSRSIIVSADGYVVDGHHQWLAAREKGEPIQAIRLDQNIREVLDALKDMPSAQPEQAAQTSYTLPEGNVSDAWVDAERRRPEHQDFQPNARQQMLMDVVAKGIDAGVFYTRDMLDYAAKELNVPVDVLSQNKTRVEGGDFGYDVYLATKAVEAKRGQAEKSAVRDAMSLKPGDELGTLIFNNDFKVNTNVVVESVSDDGLEVRVNGKRGRYVITIKTGPIGIKSAIERAQEKGKRKDGYDEFVAGRTSKQPDAAPAQQDSQAAVDQPIASKPFATSIEKTKTGWIIKGDPEALAQHARDIFGKGVVKRKDGISLATKTDDVAGNFPARYEEYRLADLPERHGRIEVRVNQDGSASVRSMDGGYMGPQLPSVAEAIANHRKEFGDGEAMPATSEQPNAAPAKTQAETRKGEVGMKLESGEQVLTNTGRKTTPFPKVSLDTNRKASNTLKLVDRWLMQNALDEARSRSDEFNARQFEASLENPQQADKDAAEEYLFGGYTPAVVPSILKPLVADGGKPTDAQAAPAATTNADLEAIFDQLDGITQRTQAAGQQAAAAHPQAERIQFVQKHILDILEDLEDSGKVTINC